MHGKSLILSLSTKKEISKLLIMTDQFHFFLFLVKFLRKSYLILFFDTFKGIVFFLIAKQVFDLLIHVSVNFFLFIFMHLFILTIPSKMWEEGIFLDKSKAFDRVWHEGLIYKRECIGLTGMPLQLLHNIFQNRHQQVLLNGQCSSWEPVCDGVPQDSVLGGSFPLFNLHKSLRIFHQLTNYLLMIPPSFLL